MVAFDASESLTPFKVGQDARDGYGAILCDAGDARQVGPDWFKPEHWGDRAKQVTGAGRGGAWFVDTPLGPAVLRHYLRGGWAASVSRDAYLWRGANQTRSFAEFRLTRDLHGQGLPVPKPLAACYRRQGVAYRAAILVQRIEDARGLAEYVAAADREAPWEETGRLLARFHRVGLEHADLNAHNILFQGGPSAGNAHGWLIDFDKGRLRIPATGWRERNLSRLRRSLLKLRGDRDASDVVRDFERLRVAYDAAWQRGY